MNEAWASEPKKRKKLMLSSLKRVRRLNADMKAFPVLNELKQNHSVLLYSLRMLEARLQSECPESKATEIHEGPLDESPEMQQQLRDAEKAFEDQLAADVKEI